MEDAFVVRLDVDDGSKFRFADDFVVLRLAAAHDNQSSRHGFERIHRRRVGVKLVENYIGIVHHQAIFGERHRLGNLQFRFFGIFSDNFLRGAKHDVGAFVFRPFAVDADEKAEFSTSFSIPFTPLSFPFTSL